ncbi:MAG: hypothetical protein IH957_01155 [Chloroflexi bacterium]|nr:hypothetical protein [Chloroflexota bacterium]
MVSSGRYRIALLTIPALAGILALAIIIVGSSLRDGSADAATDSPQPDASAVPAAGDVIAPAGTLSIHFLISNQSLGTGIAELPMTVSLDDADVFDEMLPVETQHHVVRVNQDVSSGSHEIAVTVGDPHNISESTVVEVTGDVWLLIQFWFDPQSAHEDQHTPFITIEIRDKAPALQ